MIISYVDEIQDNWDEHLIKIALGYNCSIHNGTQILRFEMRFGETSRITCDIVFGPETAARPRIEYEDHIENNAEKIQLEDCQDQINLRVPAFHSIMCRFVFNWSPMSIPRFLQQRYAQTPLNFSTKNQPSIDGNQPYHTPD